MRIFNSICVGVAVSATIICGWLYAESVEMQTALNYKDAKLHYYETIVNEYQLEIATTNTKDVKRFERLEKEVKTLRAIIFSIGIIYKIEEKEEPAEEKTELEKLKELIDAGFAA